MAECCWSAGVPHDAVHFVRTPDDAVGRHLITHPDIAAVILTGAWDTAQLFRSWRPDLRLFAETSGKNALIITPNADLDLAVADLVHSAFGHAGQKCSAASLAICVGDVGRSERFRRQLVDATRTLAVGPATDLTTEMNPTIGEPDGKAPARSHPARTGRGVAPRKPERRDDGLWTPGIRIGVSPGSWFHTTECFGPVLGIMEAPSLDAAIALQNGTGYGLTGGIHSLDQDEVDYWTDRVEVGNAYVNRSTTGAIVRRQPFGGWKRSDGRSRRQGRRPELRDPAGDVATHRHRARRRAVAGCGRNELTRRRGRRSSPWSTTRPDWPSNPTCSAIAPSVRRSSASAREPPTRELERVRMAARTAGVRLVESRALDEDVDVAQRRLLIRVGRPRPRPGSCRTRPPLGRLRGRCPLRR